MNVNNEDLNNRFKLFDYGKIMQTSSRSKEGTAQMVCRLFELLGKDEFGNDVYSAEILKSNLSPQIIKISTAEMNPATMYSVAWAYNTKLYFEGK